jgi:hypothetical protein
MKPFHYNQDPIYAAAASILTGQQLTENVVAFKSLGFKQLNGLMSDDEIHRAVNSTIKRESLKLGDSTWNVVADIYGRRDDGTWTGDWILARKGGGAWLTTKDGGAFKAHDSISSVLSFFKMEEGMEQMEEGDEELNPKFLIKNYQASYLSSFMGDLDDEYNKELIKSFKSFLTKHNLKPNEVLVSDDEVLDQKRYKSLRDLLSRNNIDFTEINHNYDQGSDNIIIFSVKTLTEGEDFHSQKMIKNQLQTIVRNSNICLQMVEDGREFPEWAQSEIAVAEAGVVSVTEFMESHTSDKDEDETKVDEAKSSYGMGTATIVDVGNKSGLDGKQVNIFHKFDDGRINVQYTKSDRKGDVRNLTLTKGQYKLDEAVAKSTKKYSIVFHTDEDFNSKHLRGLGNSMRGLFDYTDVDTKGIEIFWTSKAKRDKAVSILSKKYGISVDTFDFD